MANNRTCLTCGKTYEYCGSCPSGLNLPVWKNLFDTENCKIIFETVSDYAQKVITKQSAKEKILACDLSGRFKENITKYIDDILTDDVMEKQIDAVVIPDTPKLKHTTKKKLSAQKEDGEYQ